MRSSPIVTSLAAIVAVSVPASALLAADSEDPPKTIQHVTLKDGRTLDGVLHDDGSFTLYDLKTGKVLATMQVAADAVVSSTDEPLAAAAAAPVPATTAPAAGTPVPSGEHGAGLAGKWTGFLQPAQTSAKKTGKPLLMLFTDSESLPGKNFATTVLDDINFKNWSRDYTVLFQTDASYAKKKTPNAVLIKQDEDLARRFAVTERPMVVMMSAAGKELARQGFKGGQAEGWMDDLQGKLAASFAAASATSATTASADPAPAPPAGAPLSPTAPTPASLDQHPDDPPKQAKHRDPAPPPADPPPAAPPVPSAGGAPPPLGGANGTVNNLRQWRDAGKPKGDE